LTICKANNLKIHTLWIYSCFFLQKIVNIDGNIEIIFIFAPFYFELKDK